MTPTDSSAAPPRVDRWTAGVQSALSQLPVGLNGHGLAFFKYAYYNDYATLLTGAAINLAPLVVVFFIFQRYFLKEISTSGLAGR